MLGWQEVGEEIAGGIDYNTDLFEAATIERLVASYERVLQAVVADAEQRVSEIELLSEAERQQFIDGWNETARRVPRAESTLSELFEEQVERTPEAVALVFEDRQLSYARVERAAPTNWRTTCASGCRARGAGRRSVWSARWRWWWHCWAMLKAGGAYVPLDPAIRWNGWLHACRCAPAVCVDAGLLAPLPLGR